MLDRNELLFWYCACRGLLFGSTTDRSAQLRLRARRRPATNERDDLGDDLVPDFITLKDKITIPNLLIQAHWASMGMIIYDGDQLPFGIPGVRLRPSTALGTVGNGPATR
jgi:hypothetical protein